MAWPACPLEQIERLELLRIVWNGGCIHMHVSDQDVSFGVDNPQDLARVRKI